MNQLCQRKPLPITRFDEIDRGKLLGRRYIGKEIVTYMPIMTISSEF